MTQEQLARAAHVPRPNLSAIEQDRRELSLSTLRALALALDTTPGTLVDGITPPLQGDASTLTRAAIERIVRAVVRDASVSNPLEHEVAQLLRLLTTQQGRRASRRGSIRSAQAAWLRLQSACGPALLQTLLDRTKEQRRLHESQAD